jgi:SPP1 family phage portal protein
LYFWTYEKTEYLQIYEPFKSEQWIQIEDQDWKRNEDGDSDYPFDYVPVIEYRINKDGDPLFEAEKKIIDAHDRLMSNSANEIDRFNALIALFPGKVTKEFVDKLHELRLIDDLENYEHWPAYLEKNLAGVTEFYNELANRYERLFHKTIKVPDMTDPQFGGSDASGVARAFKILGMEFKASIIEVYFNKGLVQRKRFFDSIIDSGTSDIMVEDYTMEINSKRNLPIDEKSKAEIAQILKGVVSDETLLKFLPRSIVQDPEKEMEKIKEQRESNPLLGMLEQPVNDDE